MSRDEAVRFIERVQAQLAAFAKESYALDGRGVILVDVPGVAPETRDAIVATEMVYHTLSEVRGLTADLQGRARDEADVLLRMIATYDPDEQAVVTLAFETGKPISVKLRLNPPFLVEEPEGVH